MKISSKKLTLKNQNKSLEQRVKELEQLVADLASLQLQVPEPYKKNIKGVI